MCGRFAFGLPVAEKKEDDESDDGAYDNEATYCAADYGRCVV
jgi:hypothetical protein